MCGIAGILQFKNPNDVQPLVRRMTDAIAHRGPDADGFFIGDKIALGHRRLSIIDVSAASNQPFRDHSGRYMIVFNGEMYNYQEVKNQLGDYPFHTTGDTEVLIAAYAKWGAGCIQYFRGMFAFAIWDIQENELFVARDRMGVKPLYYYIDEHYFLFSSELRSILASGLVKRKVNTAALLEFFSYQSIGYPHSIIEGIQQLEAGSWMKIKEGITATKRYWEVADTQVDFDFTDKNRVHRHIRGLMLQSIERRLVSDVPVGAFLSGGIDSGAVVGLMAEAGTAKPNTFNVSFEEKDFDESGYAGLIARKFQTNHTRILLKPTVFLDEMQNALDDMDTPSGDGINTYVVSKAVKQFGITVALSGVGGDELFAGYPLFLQYLQMQQKSWLWKLPSFMRDWMASSVLTGTGGSRKKRLQQMLRTPSCAIENMYPIFRQIFSPKQIEAFTSLPIEKINTTALQRELTSRKKNIERLPLLSQVSVAEYLGYTQQTLLKDTDQMSMAVALEVREPFFDQDLVEFVLAVPDSLKKPTYPKSLLVESLKPLLPDEIVFRKKQGFLFPWNVWIRNDLRDFCGRHIQQLAQRPFIHGDRLTDYWTRFLKGDENVRWAEIWLFVVLEYWLEKNGVE